MDENEKNIKRMCIYVTYDKYAIIDDYIVYILNELRDNCERLILVCNYSEICSGKENVEPLLDQIFYRENIGYDCGAFKDAMCNLIGWDEIREYDELVLVNDSFFGPFVPFSNIFQEMEEKNVDFWGLIAHPHLKNNEIDIPEHIQSFFLTIQSRMLHSDDFRKYWEELPFFNRFNDVVKRYEHTFTSYFKEKGYRYSYLADISKNNSVNLRNNFWQYAHICYELIQKRNFPFLKKQQLIYDTLEHQTQENYYKSIKYVEKYTNYNVNLIWRNIIRTLDPNVLYKNLHLDFIINENILNGSNHEKILICVKVMYESAVEYVLEYLNPFLKATEYIEVLICSESNELLKNYGIEGYKIINCQNEKDILEIAVDYEYICFIHDYDLSSEEQPSYITKSKFFNVWENLIKNVDYVNNVICLMKEKKHIGLLMPPTSNFGVYFKNLYNDWNREYYIIENIIKKYNLNCVCKQEIPPFAISNNIWIRGDILRGAKDIVINEKQWLTHLWIYIAQNQLYLSGIVENYEYAAMDKINLQTYLGKIVNQVSEQYGKIQSFSDLQSCIFSGAVKEFCIHYSKIYVYGTGYFAKKYKDIIPKINGYVVSDGQEKAEYFEKNKVFFLSEIIQEKDIGIIICLDKKNQSQVIPLLEKQNFNNYFCV